MPQDQMELIHTAHPFPNFGYLGYLIQRRVRIDVDAHKRKPITQTYEHMAEVP